LRSVIARGTGRATNVNEYVFGKTGSNGNDDAWFIGFYDPPNSKENKFSIGVWCGNDNNKTKMTSDSTGGRVPTRIASRFIKNLLKNPNDQQETKTSNEENKTDDQIADESTRPKKALKKILDDL
jgi:membrane peptidoglycan carboxypeptidase